MDITEAMDAETLEAAKKMQPIIRTRQRELDEADVKFSRHLEAAEDEDQKRGAAVAYLVQVWAAEVKYASAKDTALARLTVLSNLQKEERENG